MAKVEFYAESKESVGRKTVQDVLEEEKGLSIQYTDGTAKSIEVATGGGSGGTGGAGGGVAVKQVTKLDVTAPKEVQIPVAEDVEYKFAPAEVLKFKAGGTNVAKTVCGFDNGDAGDFEENEYVEFDGKMKLIKSVSLPFTKDQNWTDGYLTTTVIKKEDYQAINNVMAGLSNGIGVNIHGDIKTVNGKPYLNVTPNMTSMNTPAPYVVTTTLDSNYYGAGRPWNLFSKDKSGGVCWQDAGHIIVLDMGGSVSIDYVELGLGNDQSGRKATLQGSNDNVNYANICSVSSDNPAGQNILLPNTVNYRYYRINPIRSVSWHATGVARFYSRTTEKYLIKEDGIIKTIQDGALVELVDQDITLELFNNNGFVNPSLIANVISGLQNTFTILALSENGEAEIGLQVIPHPQLIIPTGDLQTYDLAAIKTASIVTTGTTGIAKVVLSFDKGATWKTFKDGSWQDIALTTEAVGTDGILHNQLSAIPEAKWAELLGKTLRFAYYLEKAAISDDLAVDALSITADMKGSWCKAVHGTDYDYEYASSEILNVKLLKDGSYKINTLTAGNSGGSGIAPGDVSQLAAKAGNGKVTLKWSDPQDVVLNGATLCKWAGTKVVYKEGSYPTDVSDGTLATDSMVRDQYLTKGFEVTGLKNGVTYYFALFPYSDTGATNKNAGNQVSATPNIYRTMTVKVDLANSDPATCCSYADDAVDMIPGRAAWDEFFGHYPVMFKDGKEVGKLNPDDFTKFVDGTAADITSGAAGDVMIAFPRRGLKIETVGDIMTVSMTDDPDSPDFKYLAHVRGDERRDVFYLGAYKAFKDASNKLRSLSGKMPTGNQTITTFRSQAQANGSGYEQNAFYQLTFLQVMYLIKYANLNSQVTVGHGYANVYNTVPIVTGGTETKGMTWGSQADNQHVKLFGIEDSWGNLLEWIDGVASNADRYILTATTDFNDTGNGYLNQGLSGPECRAVFLKRPQGTTGAGFLTKEFGGSSSTYFCDNTGFSASCACLFGGSYSHSLDSGIFFVHLGEKASLLHPSSGARLMYL